MIITAHCVYITVCADWQTLHLATKINSYILQSWKQQPHYHIVSGLSDSDWWWVSGSINFIYNNV